MLRHLSLRRPARDTGDGSTRRPVRLSPAGNALPGFCSADPNATVDARHIYVSADGRSLYTANSASEVGIDSYSVSSDHLTLRWHFDPGWYEMSTDAYAPYYRPFVGMPRVP